MFPAALIGVLLLSGCADQGASSGATPTPTVATPTATATTPPNVTASPRPTGDATTAPTAPATDAPPATVEPTQPATPTDPAVPSSEVAYDTVVDACTSWQDSLGQDAATFPATQAQAAQLAATAAAGDPKWQTLASDMAGLVAIGTDTSSDAVERGQQLFTDLSTQCGTVGVTVNAG
ncbi:hypothetical protein [Subtercola sp. Z020]|uniref:hypothetical protein n=1 Tax=Subtercola sp. Z020 TaxID=2080582 RepID=UPI0011B0CBBA|nr:hypothetical protein [Subtercola sp. Z020]